MFDIHQENQYKEDRFLAAIHGIDLDKEVKNEDFKSTPSVKQQNNFVFGDPTEYEKLPESERATLTKKMMGNHQNWAGTLNVNL